MANLTLRDLTKIYPGGVRAVSHLSVEIEDGELVVILGPSGCGKSTLLRMIAGLEEVSEGEIYIGDRLVNDVQAKDRDVSMVFQSYALYPHMTIFENIAFCLKMRRVPKPERVKRVLDVATSLGLIDLLERKPKSLSGGQQQRVAVGRAIVRQPELFLFDEPLSNLDARLRVVMRAELIKLHKRLAATMVYVTHDQTEAMSIGDRLIVMKDGSVQQVGSPLEIYECPANQFVASFIGSPPMNFIDCSIVQSEGYWFLTSDGIRIQLPERKDMAQLQDRSLVLGIRPEHLHERCFYRGVVNTNSIWAKVEVLEHLGNEVLAFCLLNKKELIVRLDPKTLAESEKMIEVVLDVERVRLFDGKTGEALSLISN